MSDEKLINRVNELLSYDPLTGLFTWRVSRGCVQAGSVAGTLHSNGYIRIAIDGKLFFAHRLAFMLTYGYLPKEVDHVNGVKDDNRSENLREATRQQNLRNTGKQSNNTSGFKGVTFNKHTGKYKAQASLNGKMIYIGLCHTAEEASELYKAFVAHHHGEFIHSSVAS